MPAQLTKVDDLPPEVSSNLLLGNGFSIRVHRGFAYTTLLEVARQQKFLGQDAANVFFAFGTEDFESVLAQIWTAARVADCLAVSDAPFTEKYQLVREALWRTVRQVHPEVGFWLPRDSLRPCAEQLRGRFKRIFTLNYDLLLYWIFGSSDFAGVADFFWNPGMRFDSQSATVPGGRLPVIYLHGALFLVNDSNGDRKITGQGGSGLLGSIDRSWRAGDVPLVVAEGASEQKVRAIERSAYLRFAHRQLARIRDGVMLFGVGLSKSDNHIARALTDNAALRTIAVAVYSGQEQGCETLIQHYRRRLEPATRRGAELLFVDADEFARSIRVPAVIDWRAAVRGTTSVGGVGAHGNSDATSLEP